MKTVSQSYKAAMEHLAFSPALEADILARLQASAARKPQAKRVMLPLSLAAGTALLAGGAIALFSVNPSLFHPGQSELSTAASQSQGNDHELVYLTEEEIFHKRSTLIFMGTITELYNISDSRSIAKIQVEKSYRGDAAAGDTISILLPISFGTDYGVTDHELLYRLKTGMRGIFMPVRYQEGAAITLPGEDPAVYYVFPDGIRYLFLEQTERILYAKEAYPSLQDATTLNQVEAFIAKMLE